MTTEDKNTPDGAQEEPIVEHADLPEGLLGDDAVEAEKITFDSLDDMVPRAELDALKEDMLRLQAEMQNTRRRAEQDIEKAHKFALEKFSSELLSVIDNLERALGAADPDEEAVKPVLEGVELTLRSFLDVMGRFQVEQIDPKEQKFDPQFHEAVTVLEVPGAESNTIIDVIQKGYTLNGRLVRAAMVVVAK